MALWDHLRRPSDDPSAPGVQAPGDETEPGSASSPLDVGGHGPVGLRDRTRHGGQGSPDTNQGKAEPIPATPGEADPAAPPEPPLLADMNVGGADPQLASHPAARPRDLPAAAPDPVREDAGTVPGEDRPVDLQSTTSPPEGPQRPAQVRPGVAQRAPGSLGVSPEQQETDLQTGAARMQPQVAPGAAPAQPGDAHGVPVPHEQAAPGSSEQSPGVAGVRAPAPDTPR